MKTRNILISQDSETTVIYNTTLTDEQLTRWAEKATGEKVNDISTVKQEELQYICIDGRVWMKPGDDEKIISYISK